MRPPVESMSADELHRYLVEQHVRATPPPIQWVWDATHRIALERDQHPDEAYQAWRDETNSLRRTVWTTA